jgi:hypothetical protein
MLSTSTDMERSSIARTTVNGIAVRVTQRADLIAMAMPPIARR